MRHRACGAGAAIRGRRCGDEQEQGMTVGKSHCAVRGLVADLARYPVRADHAQLVASLAAGQEIGLPLGHSQAALSRGRLPALTPGRDPGLMTTTEVSAYLGLASPDSARVWLRRRGVSALGRESGPRGQNLYLRTEVERHHTEPAQTQGRRRAAVYDRWRDAHGVPIAEGARVAQADVDQTRGALRSRLGAVGVVVGRTQGTRLRVRFEAENQIVSIRPDLVRVIEGQDRG